MLSQTQKQELLKALKKHYKTEVLYGKGGFFVKGKGHISMATARRVTGIKPEPRERRAKSGGYGDYAIMRKIAGKV